MKKEHLAREADRLLNDEVLKAAIGAIRADALEQLATTDPADPVKISRMQQRVFVADEIFSELERFIMDARPLGGNRPPVV